MQLFEYLYNFHNGIKFNKDAFPTYSLHLAFDTIVNLKLKFVIYVNCFRPTLELKKC